MKKSTKILLAILIILAIASAAGMIYVMTLDGPAVTSTEQKEEETVLASPEDLLPEHLRIGALPDDLTLKTADGQVVSINDYAGPKGTLVVFFASWCGDCEEQLKSAEFIEAEALAAGFSVVYADRLNYEKETHENALAKLEEHQAGGTCLFDENEVLYHAWGLKEIPSEVVLSQKGTVLAVDHGVLTEGEVKGLLDRAANGPDSASLDFMEKVMITNGAVCSTYSKGSANLMKSGSESSSEGDRGDQPAAARNSTASVYAESQGLLMEYAALAGDEDLFREAFSAADRLLYEDGLYAWKADGTEKAECNALLDDFRIYQALSAVPEDFPENDRKRYSIAAEETAEAIAGRLVNDRGELVDFVNFESGETAEQLSLCYIDLTALNGIAARNESFLPAVSKAEELLVNGYISDDFPLYYASYDYRKKQYQKDPLNTAEALYTLLNLADAGLLKESSHEWLSKNVQNGTLYAKYNIDGTSPKEAHFHSTAVYALAALIGIRISDEELVQNALEKMERYRINDWNSDDYGAFLNGRSAAAFDQLMPLLVYGSMREQ